MKFSYQWIKEFVPGLESSAKELENLITVRTAECDGIETFGELLNGARVARVLSAERIEGTHISRAVVDIGEGAPITVACGADNCRAGLTTVWVPLGRKTIQGIESNGMLASAAELGVGRGHEGIIEWAASGIDLEPDQIIEIDNKSLTHRPDLWGHAGMAREVAAIVKKQFQDSVDMGLLPMGPDPFEVRVDDPELCPRFSAVAFENVTVKPSPAWLQFRLMSVGLNPINNIVDITNFVMAELAQPMHAFDRDKLAGDRLLVRRAHEGERILALNEEAYVLDSLTGVVADARNVVSIAGIIGGKESAISDLTTNIVFESANWKASAIRKTSSALKLRTDASMRFEKAQDPANTTRALARAIALMKIVCPEARIAKHLTDIYAELPPAKNIRLKLDVVNRKLGRDVPAAETADILERLAFGVEEEAAGVLRVTVPSWRATKDIAVPDDLVEEVGRMIGYDTITPLPPTVACSVPPDNPERLWFRELRLRLAARGYTEVYNYSFLSDAQAARFGLDPDDQVRVLNPIASDQNLMRSSLIPGIFANLELNAKHFDAFRFFEVGREIHRQTTLPKEINHLAAAVYSGDGDGAAGLFELKRIAELIAPGIRAIPTTETLSYEHPARTASLWLGDTEVGRLFEAHPTVITGRAAILDVNLDEISQSRLQTQYTPLRRFPSSAFDLSIFAPLRALNADLETLVRDFAGPLLEAVEYLRQYSGAPVPEGLKSVSYRVTVGAPDRTLAAEEIQQVRARIIEKIRELGYEMRV